MSCIGSSYIASNKGKGKETVVEVPAVVADEKQQARNGNEIAAEESGGSDSDSDLDSESDWDSFSEEEQPRQQQKKKKGKNKRKKQQSRPQPAWLVTLLRTRFWEPCKEHRSKNRAEQCMFCLKCCKVTCPRCTHNLPGHRLLKIRRYVYRSVVHASDMQALGVDVSRIQAYVINARKVLHLRPMSRSKHFRPQAGTPRCVTCRTWLRSTPNLFCSLTCEGNVVDVSQDDFSGPEAEVRYRSLQVQMAAEPSEAAEELPGPEAEHEVPAQVPPPPPPAANQNASLRRRPRKQAAPERAPFF